jgi:hypothetical protein
MIAEARNIGDHPFAARKDGSKGRIVMRKLLFAGMILLIGLVGPQLASAARVAPMQHLAEDAALSTDHSLIQKVYWYWWGGRRYWRPYYYRPYWRPYRPYYWRPYWRPYRRCWNC